MASGACNKVDCDGTKILDKSRFLHIKCFIILSLSFTFFTAKSLSSVKSSSACCSISRSDMRFFLVRYEQASSYIRAPVLRRSGFRELNRPKTMRRIGVREDKCVLKKYVMYMIIDVHKFTHRYDTQYE